MPVRIEICSNMSYGLHQSILGSYFALSFLSKEGRILTLCKATMSCNSLCLSQVLVHGLAQWAHIQSWGEKGCQWSLKKRLSEYTGTSDTA